MKGKGGEWRWGHDVTGRYVSNRRRRAERGGVIFLQLYGHATGVPQCRLLFGLACQAYG